MRIREAVNVKASDFNWTEGTVIVLGKGNRYRKCLAGNGLARQWFSRHDTFEFARGSAQTMLKRLKSKSGITCNAYSFRRGFYICLIKSSLIYMCDPGPWWLGEHHYGEAMFQVA